MIITLTIIILLACGVLAFFVLIQAPKGGGLTGAFGSMSSQVMGVKQSSDVMEKGTWASIGLIAILCIMMTMFYPKIEKKETQQAPAKQEQQKSPAPAGGGQPQK
ncbi:MAG: preprotein translocase subunit SecG [Flavipsychrobacter sp.]|nr:preprotein translocase subunit SecG [Flavipsychrobacter sp.]